jgi:anti-sigma factor RsiW
MPSYSTDLDNIVRYVLGDMAVDEQIAFEVRKAEDDELAQAVIAASAIDDLLRRAAEQDRRGRSRAADPLHPP